MKYYKVMAIWYLHADSEDMAILRAGNLGITKVDKIEVEQESMPSTIAARPTGPVRED